MCSTGSFPIVFTVFSGIGYSGLISLDWAQLPAPLLSVAISLPHSKCHPRPHCLASLGKPPSLTPLSGSVSTASWLPISDRSSAGEAGFILGNLRALWRLGVHREDVRNGYVAKKWEGLGAASGLAPGWRSKSFSWVMEQLPGLWGDCPPQEGLSSRVFFKKAGRSYMQTLLAKNMSSAAQGDRDKADSGF